MLDLFAGIIAIMFIATILAVMIGLLVLVIVIRIIGAIVSAIGNRGKNYSGYQSNSYKYIPDPPAEKDAYNIDTDYAIPPRSTPKSNHVTISSPSTKDDYIDYIETDNDEEKTVLEIEEEERMSEPYICPECFEPYDGIYCEVCGHSNNDIGYEEESEADKFFDDMMAMAMFDAEDKRIKAERAERDGFIFGEDEYDDDW